MRVAVIGAGAVGGYFGGRLLQGGADVIFLVRGKTLEALRRGPLRVESIKGDFAVPVPADDDPEKVGPVDVVLVAVKAWQVSAVALSLRPLVRPNTVVVPLQNGVEAPDLLARVLGPEHVAGGLCKIIAFAAGPAQIKHIGAEPEISFGELSGASESARLRQLRDAFRHAGVQCEIPPDIRVAMWEKFIFIAAMSGVGAVRKLPIGSIRSEAQSRTQLQNAIREIVNVGRAHQIALPPEIAAQTLAYIEKLPAAGTTSMQRAIAEGLPSELEAQTGAVVRLGRAASIPTPTHDAIYEALLPLEKRAREGGAP